MKIVFLGDSLTDGGRDKNSFNSLGEGYVKILSDKLTRLYPEKGIEIINRGVAGECVADMSARLEEDVLNLGPAAVVIMAGLGDAERAFAKGESIDPVTFKRQLRGMIKRIKAAGAKVIFLQPFLLPAPDKLAMRSVFDVAAEAISEVCVKLCNGYIAYDEILNGVTYAVPYTDYSPDGTGATQLCSMLIADTAIKALQKRLFA